MTSQKIVDIRKAFNIPDHYNKGILGVMCYAPYPRAGYYQDALLYFSDIDIKQVIVFTDNVKIADKYFPNRYPIDQTKKAIDEFLKICMCEHLILDKSDYSGLVGYLNTHPDRIIINPK